MTAKDLTGARFGRLVAVRLFDKLNYYSKGKKHPSVITRWECLCDCGNTIIVRSCHLKTGHTQSCGCLRRETTSKTFDKGGRGKERLYRVWGGMMGRCYHEYTNGFKNYGGRGIKVCDEWHDYAKFKEWAESSGYDKNAKYGECTLDRIDVNGDYDPSNCRWVSLAQQMKNKRCKQEEGL